MTPHGMLRLFASGDLVRVVVPGHRGWTAGEVVRMVGGAVEVDVGALGTYLFDPDDCQLWRRHEAPRPLRGTGVGVGGQPPPANPLDPSCGGRPTP